VLGSFKVGAMPEGLCFDGESIWVANSGEGTVTRLRAGDGALQGTYPTGREPQDICFDGANVWVANGGSDNVTKLKASDGALLLTSKISESPGVAV
jgi:DNA-binding beta-propeller fold protein YncE